MVIVLVIHQSRCCLGMRKSPDICARAVVEGLLKGFVKRVCLKGLLEQFAFLSPSDCFSTVVDLKFAIYVLRMGPQGIQ